MRRIALCYVVLLPLLTGASSQGDWSKVAPGIEYRAFHLEGPTEVFAVRADRESRKWIIDTAVGQGRARDGCETVPDMASRCDETIDFEGNQYDVKAAINGDYFSFETCRPPGGQISRGWFVKRFGEYTGGSGFVWTRDRRTFLGGNVRNGKKLQQVAFDDDATMKITRLNEARQKDELVLYTPQWAERTYTSDDGVEVVVEVPTPVAAVSPTTGRIIEVHRDLGSNWLPFDCVVLSGHGEAAKQLAEHAHVGDRVQIELGIKDFGVDTIKPAQWEKPVASLGGHFYCVVDGEVPVHRWEPKGKPGAVKRHPRTAVAFNDRYVYFAVVDGRSERSVGMTITELGRFCVDHLHATYAIAQDGGGSSTLWVDGKVRNVPSDGKLRPVSNGYFMALVDRPKASDLFATKKSVRIRNKAVMRLGPGTQFAPRGEVQPCAELTIVQHRLNGVRAKGTYWWKCRSEGLEGWLPQSQLETAIPSRHTEDPPSHPVR